MRTPGQFWTMALAASLTSMLVAPAAWAAEPPQINKPRPTPTIPGRVLPLPPSTYDPTLKIGGNNIKARKIETRLSVDVRVNERGPYRFIVDSGADSSVIGAGLARQLELPLGTPAIVHGMTETAVVDRVRVDALTVGATTVHNLQLPALSEGDVGGLGIIGLDALVEQRLLLDFDARLIKVEDAHTPVQVLPGEIVVVARRRRGQLIMTGVRADNQRLDAIIDTGSEVTIGNVALRDRLVRKGSRFQKMEMVGVTGAPLKIEFAFIAELEIGPILLRDVPIAFVDAPPFKLFGLADQPALLLGTDLMENFRRISLDFRARRVRFQLRRCSSEGILISTSPDRMSRIQGVSGKAACVD